MTANESENENETITVAEVSEGPGGAGEPGQPVALPVVEVLTGRAFVTGKSGSGKSNTMSVVAEKLLDAGYPLLVVDTDGEYYGLKEKYELLHAGADEECDIRVGPEHAEKLAGLALESNVPIILDVSSYLEEDAAKALLTAVTRQLFAKEKKQKKPFLMIIEEVHEYVPEGGGLDECGRMLVKVGKRGRKHGLGIAGISQRPADVKKDFITQCDWLVWHRLTWDNDTQVVRRVVGDEYADAVEGLDDGEAFLMTDWSDAVRRVRFRRKRTFDAGATPGLEDFERPELKSVSDALVSELEAISEAERRREDELERLRAELERRQERIEELEAELSRARNVSRVADQFVEALAGDDVPAADGTAAEREGDGRPAVEPRAAAGRDSTGERPRGVREPPEAAVGSNDERPVVRELEAALADLDPVERRMLARYREEGYTTPMDAHVAAGGAADRELAYSRNRTLRQAGFIEHVGLGQYVYALPVLVEREHDGRLDQAEQERIVGRLERAF